MRLKLLFTFLLVLLSSPSWAARPFVTDDARLTTAGSCQLESWTRIYNNNTEYWALPACNPTGNLEFTLGAGVADYRGALPNPGADYVFQLKSLYKELETNSYGIGLAVGTIAHPNNIPGPNLMGNYYAYIPYSVSFNDDKLITHINVGYAYDKVLAQNRALYGVGAEINVINNLMLIVETFGDSANNPYWQSGVRYSVIPNLFQIDATIGQQFSNNLNARWISFGLRFTPASIF
jgi:hypothetical protein